MKKRGADNENHCLRLLYTLNYQAASGRSSVLFI